MPWLIKLARILLDLTTYMVINKTCAALRTLKYMSGPLGPVKNLCSLWLHYILFFLTAKIYDFIVIYHPCNMRAFHMRCSEAFWVGHATSRDDKWCQIRIFLPLGKLESSASKGLHDLWRANNATVYMVTTNWRIPVRRMAKCFNQMVSNRCNVSAIQTRLLGDSLQQQQQQQQQWTQ